MFEFGFGYLLCDFLLGFMLVLIVINDYFMFGVVRCIVFLRFMN